MQRTGRLAIFAGPIAIQTRKSAQARIIGRIAPPAYHRHMSGNLARRSILPAIARSFAR